MSQFWKIKLPLILPSIGIISILTFVGNFNAFDLIYAAQGALAGPNFSTDILGTFLYRTFFGFQLQLGDPNMGATIATVMFLIILAGVWSTSSPSRRASAATSSEETRAMTARSLARSRHRAPTRPDPLHGDRALPGLPGRDQLVQVAPAIFGAPLAPPTPETFDLVGYKTVLAQGDFLLYFQNSLIVTVASLFLRAAVRRDGRLRALRIPLPRQHADGPLPRARHHDPDPARHRRDPATDGRERASSTR